MLAEQGELHKRAVRICSLPSVKADYHTMHGEQQVMIRLLQRVGDGVKLALVRTAVVGLRLAWHRTHKVRVHTHSEAEHVHRLLNVGGPVATFLVVVNLVDHHLVLHLSSGRHIECGEPHLASVLNASEEVKNLLLLFYDAFLLLLTVSDSLALED